MESSGLFYHWLLVKYHFLPLVGVNGTKADACTQRLAGNHAVAAKHAEGLAQIIRLRRSNGINTPIWFREALLYNW